MTAPPQPGDKEASQIPSSAARWNAAAWALWMVPLLVICIAVVAKPGNHSLTSLYQDAVARWWSRKTLYAGPGGMNYLPQFTLFFTPYYFLGQAAGDILWRGTAAAGLVFDAKPATRLSASASRSRGVSWLSPARRSLTRSAGASAKR